MRTSLKQSRMMTIDKVVSNEELLIAILVRLPPISIFRFKCVSKRWNNILNDPYFHHSYSIRIRNERVYGNGVGRLLAFIQNKHKLTGKAPYQYTNILPVAQPNEHKIEQLPFRFSSLTHCSDGLIICYDHLGTHCVVNPITKTWVRLPKTNFGPKFCSIFENLELVCYENKEKLVPIFKVVGVLSRCPLVENRKMYIGTYTSKTRKWEMKKLIGTGLIRVSNIHHTFVYNGVFHWHICCAGDQMLAVYDSNASDRHVQVIELPMDSDCNFALTRSSSDDVLWVGMSYHESLTFWMLPKDENGSYKRKTTITQHEWILMNRIDNYSLSKEMTLSLESKKRKRSAGDTVAKSESFLKLEALIQWNPIVAVLSMRQKIFFHNLETKSTELIKYRGRPFAEKSFSRWYPIMEPLFLSTYGPLARAYN